MSQADEETSYNEYIPLALHLSDEYFINNQSRWGPLAGSGAETDKDDEVNYIQKQITL